jgi:serine/threonine-protein kinase RsbT
MSGEVLYHEAYKVKGGDFEHGGEVATQIKMVLKQFGYPPEIVRRLSIANFEAEMNLIMYAELGEFELFIMADGVRVTVTDSGQGIPDVEWALGEGNSTATAEMRARGFGAGLGLPNIRRNSDLFDIQSTVGVGTRLDYTVRAASGGA